MHKGEVHLIVLFIERRMGFWTIRQQSYNSMNSLRRVSVRQLFAQFAYLCH